MYTILNKITHESRQVENLIAFCTRAKEIHICAIIADKGKYEDNTFIITKDN